MDACRRTQQGYPYIAAGCVSIKGKIPFVLDLGRKLRFLAAPEACHPVSLDLLLAELLQPLADSFVMIGCTIGIPDVPGFSGGVLGNPGISPRSAEGFMEKLEDDWTLITFPGGPGLAVKGKNSILLLRYRKFAENIYLIFGRCDAWQITLRPPALMKSLRLPTEAVRGRKAQP